MRARLLLLILTLGLLTACCLSGCGNKGAESDDDTSATTADTPPSDEPKGDTTDEPPTADQSAFKALTGAGETQGATYTHKDSNMSLTISDAWEFKGEDTANNVQQQVALKASPDDLKVLVQGFAIAEDADFAESVKSVGEELRKGVEEVKVEEDEAFDVGKADIEGHRVTYTGKQGDAPIAAAQFFLRKGKTLYVLTALGKADALTQHEDDITALVKAVELKGG